MAVTPPDGPAVRPAPAPDGDGDRAGLNLTPRPAPASPGRGRRKRKWGPILVLVAIVAAGRLCGRPGPHHGHDVLLQRR